MFLDAYKRNWLETEGYSFEDKMIDDLSVSPPPFISETIPFVVNGTWPAVYNKDFLKIHFISYH